MSIYSRGEPVSNNQFRQNTHKNSGQLLGVTNTPKKTLCVSCQKRRTDATGRRTEDGFVCHSCWSANK